VESLGERSSEDGFATRKIERIPLDIEHEQFSAEDERQVEDKEVAQRLLSMESELLEVKSLVQR